MEPRKKTQGKERRKVAEVKEPAPVAPDGSAADDMSAQSRSLVQQQQLPGIFPNLMHSSLKRKRGCTHGWNPRQYPEEHDCHKFIQAAYSKKAILSAATAGSAVQAAAVVTNEEYPNVWKDAAGLEWISKAFVSIATEMYDFGRASMAFKVKNDANEVDYLIAIGFSELIQQSIAVDLDHTLPTVYWARIYELLRADRRRIISYLKKRIPCSCLDEMYEEVKTLPKTGTCSNFLGCKILGGRLNIVDMWSCGRCRRDHYCGEACQKARWGIHKECCKIWSKWKPPGDLQLCQIVSSETAGSSEESRIGYSSKMTS